MNIILLEPAEVGVDGRVVLADRRSEHIISVLRSRTGDTVRIGIINGAMGEGRILGVEEGKGPGRVLLAVAANRPPPPRADIDLILALPRPIMLKKIMAQAAALGVARIFLINANRVEKSFFTASILKDNGLRPYLLHGLEQAVDTMLPEVSIRRRFRPFVEDELPSLVSEYALRLVAHPETTPLATLVRQGRWPGRVLLAVGPEGGWVDFEIERFASQGFQAVSMGERILRVDTAIVALASQLSLWHGITPFTFPDKRR